MSARNAENSAAIGSSTTAASPGVVGSRDRIPARSDGRRAAGITHCKVKFRPPHRTAELAAREMTCTLPRWRSAEAAGAGRRSPADHETFLAASRNPTGRSSPVTRQVSVDCQGGRQPGRSRSAPSDPWSTARAAVRPGRAGRHHQPSDAARGLSAQASRRVIQAGAAPQHRTCGTPSSRKSSPSRTNPCWAYMSASTSAR